MKSMSQKKSVKFNTKHDVFKIWNSLKDCEAKYHFTDEETEIQRF